MVHHPIGKRDGEFWVDACLQNHVSPGPNLASRKDPEIEAGTPVINDPGRQLLLAMARRQLVARLTRLGYLDADRADRHYIADADGGFIKPAHGEVFTKCTLRQSKAEARFPVRVMMREVDTHGLVRATVVDQVGLFVSSQSKRCHGNTS